MLTCMQKKVNIESNSPKTACGSPARRRRQSLSPTQSKTPCWSPACRWSWRTNPSRTPWRSPASRRGWIQNPTHNRAHGDHLHAEEDENQVQLNLECQGHHMHSITSKNMSTISDVSTGHIFSLDFWTNLLESKAYILSLSLTAAHWGKFLKHLHAFEVSLSLFWNNSNVFS